MAREIASGTPGRTKHYIFPRAGGALLTPALGLGLLVSVLLLAAQAAGFRAALAPGGVASGHTPVATRCEECHVERQGVSNLRCERCHDPVGAGGFGHKAHVLFGSQSAQKAALAKEQSCGVCHVEHRGRVGLAVMDAFQCFECHFRRFSAHPEFAVLREKRPEAPGLKFSHEGHIKECADKGSPPQSTCAKCHGLSSSGRDLDPISFERHCASCHESEGSICAIAPLPVGDVLPPEAIQKLGIKGDWVKRTDEFTVGGGRVGKAVVHHKDEWVVYNMLRLRRVIDPEGYAAERSFHLARVAQLRQRLADLRLADVGADAASPVVRVGRQAAIEKALEAAQAKLERVAEEPPPAPTPAERERATAALETLTEHCTTCHVLSKAAFAPMAAAQPVLRRSTFAHGPHLLYADCARCHPGIEKSAVAEELHLTGIASCRECHAPSGAREDCERCHRYHPRPAL